MDTYFHQHSLTKSTVAIVFICSYVWVNRHNTKSAKGCNVGIETYKNNSCCNDGRHCTVVLKVVIILSEHAIPHDPIFYILSCIQIQNNKYVTQGVATNTY